MTDLLGPASAANSVTSRPADARVFGSDDTWMQNCSSPDAQDGTEIEADFINGMLAQMRSAIRGMGVATDNAADDMLLDAIKLARLRYGVDTGAADALVVTLDPAIPAYATELTINVVAAYDSATDSPVININGRGAKTIKGANGAPLAAGDIKAGYVHMITYDGTHFRLVARWIVPSASGSAYQPGDYILSPLETPPAGTLECDGAAVSRATYAALFAKIGTAYGAGNGTTTFNIPDTRGYFMRAWDHGAARDPNAGSRTTRGDGVTGDRNGTKQADDFKSHSHPSSSAAPPAGLGENVMTVGGGGGNTLNAGGEFQFNQRATLQVTVGNAGGSETRPKNMNWMICIAY